jgi:predicted nicotinamide N-methyase
MTYPLISKRFSNGVTLDIPDPDLVKPTYEALLKNNPAAPFPFWARIWPSAIALSAYLDKDNSHTSGKRVIEIGAGLGLPAFTCAATAKEIIITDHAAEAVALAGKNIRRLKLANATARLLDWNNMPLDVTAETILLSDVNYAPDQFESLHAMIRRFVAEGSTVVLATPQRITAGRFVEVVGASVKSSTIMTINEDGQTSDISISVLSL